MTAFRNHRHAENSTPFCGGYNKTFLITEMELQEINFVELIYACVNSSKSNKLSMTPLNWPHISCNQ